jgi:hypothetical protein
MSVLIILCLFIFNYHERRKNNIFKIKKLKNLLIQAAKDKKSNYENKNFNFNMNMSDIRQI